jgi:hypothetical protein
VTKTTVGGQPATIVTATTANGLDGSLGCPALAMAAPDCFGLQQDLVLRIAVVNVAGKTLLVWLRHDRSVSADVMAKDVTSFEQMLASIRFSTRPVQTPSS